MNYVAWALLGMIGYSLTTFFVKLATRDGQLSPFVVLVVAVTIVVTSAISIVIFNGDLARLSSENFRGAGIWYAVATGIVLAVAVSSLFKALSMGPASVVVPVYGMFIVGGAILGIAFLGEPLTLRKIAGIALAAVSIFLIAGDKAGK